jgi:hypothetical protein
MNADRTNDSLTKWKAANEALRSANDDYLALPEEQRADPTRAEQLITLRRDEASAWNVHMEAVLSGLGS